MPRAFSLHIPRSKAVYAKRVALGLLFGATALCAVGSSAATTKVTVQQLEQDVAGWHDLADKDMAPKLALLELSERLNKTRLERLNAALPGDKSRLALLAVADSSAFLSLPQADLLKQPVPDAATQGRMVSQAADFVVETVGNMPSFLASQTTTRFQDLKVTGGMDQPVVAASEGFHFVDKLSANVTFKQGREVIEVLSGSKSSSKDSGRSALPPTAIGMTSGLNNWGIFGPLLGVVMADILKGKIGWGHWEQGEYGPLAVFRYAVSEEHATYTVRYCCFRNDRGDLRQFETIPAYHGELAINPKTGAVMRLVMKMDLTQQPVMKRVEQVVDYGPVVLGGKTYICPLRSVSITQAQTVVSNLDGIFGQAGEQPSSPVNSKNSEVLDHPMVTAINDIVFDDYHQFRSELRVLSGANTDQDGAGPGASQATAPGPASRPQP